MKKTALKQLIEQLEEQKEAIQIPTYQKGLEYAIQAAKLKLETEREQIEDAYNDMNAGAGSSKQYYKDTYEMQSIINSTQTTDNGVNVSERKH